MFFVKCSFDHRLFKKNTGEGKQLKTHILLEFDWDVKKYIEILTKKFFFKK